MSQQENRAAAVAGSWYPADPDELRRAVRGHLAGVTASPAGEVVGVIAPHAGLRYSGPVAAHAYRAVADRDYEVVVLVGPSHYVGFEGVAVHPGGSFETPLGPVPVHRELAGRLLGVPPVITHPAAHLREHSLEMQLPFLREVLPRTPIVPLVIGFQDAETVRALADVLTHSLRGVRALLVASTDLSHFFDRDRAAALDAVVVERVERFDTDGLAAEYERYPASERGRYVACGGGAALAVMRASAALGARDARVLCRSDSGAVSGETDSVVGYMAAALGRFAPGGPRASEAARAG